MDVREKLIELIKNGVPCPGERDPFGEYCDTCRYSESADCSNERLADYLISHGVTVQGCAEWEEIEADWSMETIYKCSTCKEEFVTIDGTPPDNLWNYCPHCGAKMMNQPPKGE